MFRRKEDSFDFESEENETETRAEKTETRGEKEESTAPASASARRERRPAAAPSLSSSASAKSTPARAPSASAAPAYRPSSNPATPARATQAPARSAATPSAGGNMQGSSAGKASKRILTVGNDILLKGEIATCDRLVIEGSVDAKLKDVHTVEIAETGSFKGAAEIQDAEISGLFEGTLVVRNRLTIYSTGQVRGHISYGEVEIERGGQLVGEIGIAGEGNLASMPTEKKRAA